MTNSFSIRLGLSLDMVLFMALVFLQAVSVGSAQDTMRDFRFDFGTGNVAQGWKKIDSNLVFDRERGFGFDFETSAKFLNRTSSAPIKGDLAFSETPFYFSVNLPEGNYRVSLVLGDAEVAANCTVKTDSRQLMLENVKTDPGEFVMRSFTVNTRTTKIAGGGEVRLKQREVGRLHWDDKLTIEFNGSPSAVCAMEITPVTDATTVFLLGDSTVTDQPAEPWNSWGQMLPRFFNDQVAISNHAASGESIKSSLRAGRVKKVLSMVQPGDYVLAQFGHNDMKDKSPDALSAYRANLEDLVADVRGRGGIPVLVTSMERKSGVKKQTLGRYPETVRQIARDHGVALIDLNAMSLKLYRAMGSRLSELFQDGTHHNSFGSYQLAQCVVTGIRNHLPELAQHLRSDAPTFAPEHPDNFRDWRVPASPNIDLAKPEGS